jgi:hypothetical protein
LPYRIAKPKKGQGYFNALATTIIHGIKDSYNQNLKFFSDLHQEILMENKADNRRLLITCAVLLGVMCIFISLISIGYAALIAKDIGIFPFKQATLQTPDDQDAHPFNQELSPTAVITPTSPATDDIPLEIAQQMDHIQEQVSELRGLPSLGPVTRLLLTRDELRQRLVDEFNNDYSPEEAQEDAIVLSVFGLLEPDFDLYNFFLNLYTEQISGFYDTKTKEMYVVLDDRFGGMQKLTYAHEYVHALQDQHFDIREGLKYNDEDCEDDSERCAAIRALLEGDASFTELQWFSLYASQQDFSDLQEYFQNYESPIFDSSPEFIQKDLLFPYIQGQAFVEHLFRSGGWEAINQTYQDVPVSTKQILQPERYPYVTPIPVNLPDMTPALGENWRKLDKGVLGEWYTYLILAHGRDPNAWIDESEAQSAADGWAGDAYMVYYNDQNSNVAMLLKTEWDDETQANEFADTFIEFTNFRFGRSNISQINTYAWETDQNYTFFSLSGTTTMWMYSNNEETFQALWEQMP